jgi:MFS family permease
MTSEISATPAITDSSRGPSSWVTRDVMRILATQVVFGFGWSLYLLNPKFYATQLHAPPDVIGQITSMGGTAGLLTVPFAAFGLDRSDRRVFFRVGSLLIFITSIGMLQVHDVSWLVFALQGCVSAAFVLAFNASAALLSDYAPADRLGQAIGWLGGANVAMNAVATMVAEPLAHAFGWDAVFFLGIAAGGAAFVASFGLKLAPVQAVDPGVVPAPVAPRRFESTAFIAPLLFSATLMGAIFIALFGFVQPYAVSLGASEVRYFFLGFTLAAVGCRVLLGGLGDRVGRRTVSMWMLGGYAVSAALMRHLEIDALILYGLAFGAAHGLLYPTLNALLLELLPSRRRGLGMVLYNGAFNLGTSVGSLGWGLLAKRSGYPAIYEVAAVASLVAASALAIKPRAQ